MMIECPNHEGGFDCTPFCPLCEGEQEYESIDGMSVGKDTIGTMKTYIVNYTATYEVEAENEDEAIALAILEHEDMPDGDWEVNEQE